MMATKKLDIFLRKGNAMSERNRNNGGRKGPGKTILAIFLAIADMVLLAVIICGVIDSKVSQSHDVETEVKRSAKRTTVDSDFESKKEFDNEQEQAEEQKQEEEIQEPEPVVEEEPEEQEEPKESEILEDLQEPSLSDFMWYFDDVYWNGIPKNSSRLSDSAYLSGDWKIFIWFDHEKGSDAYWIEFGNVNLDFSDDNVNVVINPCKLYPPSGAEPVDLTNSGIDKYNGKFDGDELNATGAGNFHIINFYTLDDGKQYAVGSIDEPDGTPTVIALVRSY